MLWLWVLAAIFCSILFYWIYVYIKFEKYLRDFPGPVPLPIIGNAHKFNSPIKNLKAFYEYSVKYKKNYKVYLGFDPVIVVNDPKTLQFFLSNNEQLTKSKQYKFLTGWLRQGLLISTGSYWRRHRKIITPAFHFKILEQYVKIFDSVADVLIGVLRKNADRDIDIYPVINVFSLDVMCESAMGTSVNALINSNSTYVQCVKKIGRLIIHRSFSPIASNDFLYSFTKNSKIEQETLKILHGYTRDVITRRKNELIAGERKNEAEQTKRKQVFLDLLLDYMLKGENLTEDEIQEEVDTFLFEGHDTTSAALSFTLYTVSRHNKVQRKIYDEQRKIFSDDLGRPATCEDLQEMRYLEMVIKESMRLYTPVPMYGRRMTENVVHDGLTYPKDTTIVFFAFGVHRDPRYFDDPEKFNPERFSSEFSGVPFSYLPFSAGARNCIGQKFAMLDMKCVLSKIFRNFELKPSTYDHEIALENNTILKATNGLPIVISNRRK